MKALFKACLAWSAIFCAALAGEASARGQRVSLPPVFSGGSAGDWIENGPVFGFDNPIGPGFGEDNGEGGYNGWGWGSGGGSGGGSGSGSGGGAGGANCLGNCWDAPNGGVGPCAPRCDCYPSPAISGQSNCVDVRPGLGVANDCKNSGSWGCKVPD